MKLQRKYLKIIKVKMVSFQIIEFCLSHSCLACCQSQILFKGMALLMTKRN